MGEVGHLVRDFEVLLCPFPLGNKFCPVKWNKINKIKIKYLTEMYTIIIMNFMKLRSLLSVPISSQFLYKYISALQGLNG